MTIHNQPVQRFDSQTVSRSAFTETPQGGIRARGRVSRAGVLVYKTEDGETVREYRPPEEVFDPESLASLEDAPITVAHPKAGKVTAETYKELSVGHVTGKGEPEDDVFVSAGVVVQDRSTVSEVMSRDLTEFSGGYSMIPDYTSGVSPEGEAYDLVQRHIRYNHVALLPPGKGRAGSEVSLRLDSNGHQIIGPEGKTKMELTPEEMAALKALASMAPGLKALLDKENAETTEPPPAPAAPAAPAVTVTDAPTESAPAPAAPAAPAADEKPRMDSKAAPLSPEEQERIVLDAVDIRTSAKKVLGDSVSLAGKTSRQVMVEAISRVDDKLTVVGKKPSELGDEALRATFESQLIRFAERSDSSSELAEARRLSQRNDSEDPEPSSLNAKLRGHLDAAHSRSN